MSTRNLTFFDFDGFLFLGRDCRCRVPVSEVVWASLGSPSGRDCRCGVPVSEVVWASFGSPSGRDCRCGVPISEVVWDRLIPITGRSRCCPNWPVLSERRCCPNAPVLSELAPVGTPNPHLLPRAFPSHRMAVDFVCVCVCVCVCVRVCWVGVGSPPTEQCVFNRQNCWQHTHTHTRTF